MPVSSLVMISCLTRALEAPSCSTKARAGRSVGMNSTQSLTSIGPTSGYWSNSKSSADKCLVRCMSITSTAREIASILGMKTPAPRESPYIQAGRPVKRPFNQICAY